VFLYSYLDIHHKLTINCHIRNLFGFMGEPRLRQHSIQVTTTTSTLTLNWRTFHRTIGTKNTAITLFRSQHWFTVATFIKKQTRIT